MAKPVAKPPVDSFPAIKAEVGRRYSKAKTEKQLFNDDIREAYSFVMPRRVKPQTSGGSTETRPSDTSDNFSTLGEELVTDFASDMADTFIPEQARWASVEASEMIPDEIKEDVAIALKADADATFGAITASNFHETGKQAFKDLAVSAFGMAIKDPGAGEPIECQVIPIGELLILRDARGGIGTRIWDRSLNCQDIEELFPDIKLPEAVQRASTGKKYNEKFCVLQGCYRDYSVRAEVAWVQFTQIAEEIVEGVRVVGVGSANIIVGRWDPDPTYAWGNGPAIKGLADFRQLDETEYLKLKGMARQVDPPLAYDDDQVMNLDGGIPNGVAIPRMKGSKIDIIESRHGMDAALYAVQEVEERLRRHFYQDGPVQKGKTPPTLGQWADESLQKQRRLGTPAAPLWREFLQESYMRFRWLLIKRGAIQEKIMVGKEMFPVRPINPLKRAAQQEEAVACERFLGSVANLFGPNLLPTMVDVGTTVHNLKKLGAADGVTLQSAEAINDAIKQNAQALMLQQSAQTAGAAAPLLKQ